jgi:hypothetical protein
MTRDQFVQKAVDAGLSDADIKSAMNDRRAQIGAFDDEVKPETATSEKPGLFNAMFPRTASEGGFIKAPALDLLSLPGRAISSIGEGGDYLSNLARLKAPDRIGIPGRAVSGLENAFRDPATLATLPAGGVFGKFAGEGAAALSKPVIGALGRGLTEGATSAGVHIADSEGDYGGLDAAKEIGLSAAIPSALSGLGSLKSGAAKGAANMVTENLAEGGTPVSAIKMATTPEGQAFLKANKGKAYEIGKELVDNVYDPLNKISEAGTIKKIMADMTGNYDSAINALKDKIVKNPNLEMRKVNEKLNEQIDWLKKLNTTEPITKTVESPLVDAGGNAIQREIEVQGPKTITGLDLYNAQKQLDEVIADRFGKDSGAYINALKDARHALREELRNVAIQSGKPDYIKNIDALSEKLQILDRIKDRLGANTKTGEGRAESFVRNLFSAGKTDLQNVMKDYDRVFNTNVLPQSEAAHLAEFITPEGKLPYRPPIKTGYSKMDVLSFPFKSPRIAGTMTLPMLNRLSAESQPGIKASAGLQAIRSNLFGNDENNYQLNPALANLKR